MLPSHSSCMVTTRMEVQSHFSALVRCSTLQPLYIDPSSAESGLSIDHTALIKSVIWWSLLLICWCSEEYWALNQNSKEFLLSSVIGIIIKHVLKPGFASFQGENYCGHWVDAGHQNQQCCTNELVASEYARYSDSSLRYDGIFCSTTANAYPDTIYSPSTLKMPLYWG